ncbi:MAG: hypothetical protein HPY81_09730 [Firmicutes bacterium]|nr:hypothetical protein [Bacillota bacterium]
MERYLGKLFGLLLIYMFFQLHCFSLREFSELSVVFLPQTPTILSTFCFSLAPALPEQLQQKHPICKVLDKAQPITYHNLND